MNLDILETTLRNKQKGKKSARHRQKQNSSHSSKRDKNFVQQGYDFEDAFAFLSDPIKQELDNTKTPPRDTNKSNENLHKTSRQNHAVLNGGSMQSWKTKKKNRVSEAAEGHRHTQQHNHYRNHHEDIVDLVESDSHIDNKNKKPRETNINHGFKTSHQLKPLKHGHNKINDANASMKLQRENIYIYRTPTKEEKHEIKQKEREHDLKNDARTPDEDSLITHATQAEGNSKEMKDKQSSRRMQTSTQALDPFRFPFSFTKANNHATNQVQSSKKKRKAKKIKVGQGKPYESGDKNRRKSRGSVFLESGSTSKRGIYGRNIGNTKPAAQDFQQTYQHEHCTPTKIMENSCGRQQGQRLTRSKQESSHNEIIEIDGSSSDDEEEMVTDSISVDTSNPKCSNKTKVESSNIPGNSVKISLKCIVIDTLIFDTKCELKLMNGGKTPNITFSYFEKKSDIYPREHVLPLDDKSIKIKYFFANDNPDGSDCETEMAQKSDEMSNFDLYFDEMVSFIALKVDASDDNRLSEYRGSVNHDSFDDPTKEFIILELRSNDDFANILNNKIEWNNIHQKMDDDSALDFQTAKQYSERILIANKKEREDRLYQVSRNTRNSVREKRFKEKSIDGEDDKVLLVYPFTYDVKVNNIIDEEISQYSEVNGFDRVHSNVTNNDLISTKDESKSNFKLNSARTHHLTICVEDWKRLCPKEYLNDTLIDFWMRWISRKDDRHNSNVHFFTSHFFSTLRENGASKVVNWTAKKNIDIFQKKFVFIPINESLHWSLCVVVNPGKIKSKVEQRKSHDEIPCILFMDSLKVHQKNRCAKIIRKWLTHEWFRLNKSSESESPFNQEDMKVFSPTIPYQDNSWDCGVFVCRYAYGLYQQRMHPFTYSDIVDNFKEAITSNDFFDFDMINIANWRAEMLHLIKILERYYQEEKKKENAKKRKNYENSKNENNLDSKDRKIDLETKSCCI